MYEETQLKTMITVERLPVTWYSMLDVLLAGEIKTDDAVSTPVHPLFLKRFRTCPLMLLVIHQTMEC